MRITDTTVAEYPIELTDAPPDPAAAQLATIVAVSADGTPSVDVGDGVIVPARLAVRATRERLESAVVERQQAVVLFENADRSKPLIVGFLEAPQPAAGPAPVTAEERLPLVEVDVDGRRLRVTAQDEIVLQCGSASITLRRNGRVVIRGTYVETHSQGTNRIKGGQVQIN